MSCEINKKLQERIEELEAYCQRRLHLAMDSYKERDELRNKLAEATFQRDTWKDSATRAYEELDAANEKLADLNSEVEILNEENLCLDQQREKQADYMRMQEKRLRAAENELAAANEKLAANSNAKFEALATVKDLKGQLALRNAEAKECRNCRQNLQPPAPTIVKQTWQAVGYDPDDVYSEHEIRHHAYYPGCLGLLRRDHYSDGTVKAELEQTGDDK